MTRVLRGAALVLALAYTGVHVVVSGVIFPLRSPNLGQVVEELQPVYRQILFGAATVDQPRQYGPVFLFVLDPVYRLTTNHPAVLAAYCYLLGVLAIAVAFYATVLALEPWLASRGTERSWPVVLGLVLLWANFGPLYGVLAVKNVELWELAFIMVACAAFIRDRPWVVAWAIAAASLTKMLPLVFVPYLLLRNRRMFAYTILAIAVLLTVSQLVYGTDMGWGYFPNMLRASAGATGYGNAIGMTWHENVSLRGLIMKAFGFLEHPDLRIPNLLYTRGYYVVVLPGFQSIANVLGMVAQGTGLLWGTWTLVRGQGTFPEPFHTLWDWSFVAAMMLVLAPQASQDYMVLALGAFSFVLVACMTTGDRVNWTTFVLATLLVGNIAPRGAFSRAVLIDPIIRWTGYDHLTRAEAFQYFGFPLLGLLFLVLTLTRMLVGAGQASFGTEEPGRPAAT